MPPLRISFDALNHCDWTRYYEDGLRQATVLARIMLETVDRPALRVLEWGCGPARLIRHMPRLLGEREVAVTGADYNEETVAWCRKHLPGIQFVNNRLNPPLPFEAAQFDIVYCYSVFTHLSEPVQIAWAQELHRVLAPDGVAIVTTHGQRFRHLLGTRLEHERFDAGECVIQGKYREGKKWFFALHPEAFVRKTLLKPFGQVDLVRTEDDELMMQDVWVARKTAVSRPATITPRASEQQPI